VRPKLAVSGTNDPSEREADRMATKILNETEVAQPLPHAATSGESIQRQEDDLQEDEGETTEDVDGVPVRRSADGGITCGPPDAQDSLQSTRGRVQAMAPSLRRFFEPRLGHDLSRVRIHTDDRAAELSRDFRAKAFTVGQDIYFARGRFRSTPDSLLAHELVHTVQSREGAAPVQRQPDDAPEPPIPLDKPAGTTPCPTSVSLGTVTHTNHGDLSAEDQLAFRTYLKARSTMNVGPGPDHSGHCMKEALTLVSNDCPAKVYTRTNKAGEVTESEPCSAAKCLDIDRYGSGKTAFIDEHRTKVPESVLAGTAQNSCPLASH